MSGLARRVAALEVKIIADAPPLPALVRFANTDEERQAAEQELKTRPKGTRLVLIATVDCSRKKDEP